MATNYPNILVWGNSIYIKIDSENPGRSSSKYMRGTISGFLFDSLPMTYDEVMSYTGNHAKPCKDFENLMSTYKSI